MLAMTNADANDQFVHLLARATEVIRCFGEVDDMDRLTTEVSRFVENAHGDANEATYRMAMVSGYLWRFAQTHGAPMDAFHSWAQIESMERRLRPE